jgi:hypothetical protein
MNGMMGDSLMEEEEEIDLLEEWMAEDIGDEYCTEFTNSIQVNFIDLYEELEFLEKKIVNQKGAYST